MNELKINCLVLDDEQHAADVLTLHIGDTPFLHLVKATTSVQEALHTLLHEAVDVIFLDVQMPRLTGFEFMKTLQGNYHIIICSAHHQYAVEGFENDVVDFFLKPVTYARFLKGALKVQQLVKQAVAATLPEKDGAGYMFVKNGVKGKVVKIDFNSLCYAEAKKNYLVFYQDTGNVITYMLLGEAESRLPAQYFMRVHRSYIVRLSRVAMIEGNMITLRGTDVQIPVGDIYKEKLFAALGIA